eukprot:TRINITY_DN829_c0_g1_i9.p1 TRINITY_DN829_c0_g1~~TRINITY_DN829_c0_g1_i9.p1  ORF type:complete len:276 (-),score=35.96 TRINITY_DN829_c0_g1_i9:123-950(-)
MTSLNELWLNSNQLSSLPESIGLLTNLKQLYLNQNHLSCLPRSIGNLTKLTNLWTYDNVIIELPDSFIRLRKLKIFFIEWQGRVSVQRAPIGVTSLPCWTNHQKPWSNMTMTYSEALNKLQLYKHDNDNLRDVNPLIEKWRACHYMNVSNNQISALPDQLSTLTELRKLNLANNMLSSFPDVLVEMNWLTSLDISGNPLTELPEGITKISKLSVLKIADADGRIFIRRSPTGIVALPCYHSNVDLRMLTLFDPAAFVHPPVSASASASSFLMQPH